MAAELLLKTEGKSADLLREVTSLTQARRATEMSTMPWAQM